METVQTRDEYLSHMELLAHKLLLLSRVIRLGFDNVIDRLYGDDIKFLKEIEDKDPKQVKEELLDEMLHVSKHNYSALEF